MTHEERIILRLKKRPMTTDQLAKDMRTARSTVVAALNKLWNRRNICVLEYKITGSTPARLWGMGKVDAPRPPTKTREERNAQRRERRKLEREAIAPMPVVPKPDVAAAWVAPVKPPSPPKQAKTIKEASPSKEARPKKAAKKPKDTFTPKRDFAASWF